MGRAGGNSLVLDVKRRKASLVSLCPYLDSFGKKPLVLLFGRLLCGWGKVIYSLQAQFGEAASPGRG